MNPLDSKPLTQCQGCRGKQLESLLFLGYVPPVNEMLAVNTSPNVEMRFPLELLRCRECTLVQIGYEVDPRILFPHSYPYLSGTTRILRENFKDLAQEASQLFRLSASDLVIDIGANDGTLLTPFKDLGPKVLGIEPSQAADVAKAKGIEMVKDYFCPQSAQRIRTKYGSAKIITAANVFAHIKNVHEIIEGIVHLLNPEGIFISESHYLLDLIETVQYDTIYHEHLRHYSLGSLMKLFTQHGLEIFRVKRIPTHGGSIRVYTARKGQFQIDPSVSECLKREDAAHLTDGACFQTFRNRVIQSKLDLLTLIGDIKARGKKIYGIGAPSRASTLINYVGLDDGLVDAVMEVSGSHKLNKYIPGTRVPVLDEKKLYQDKPDYVLFYSWHIAEELALNLRKKGYRGEFIVPLPTPKILSEELALL